jgi:hypothetical protein
MLSPIQNVGSGRRDKREITFYRSGQYLDLASDDLYELWE